MATLRVWEGSSKELDPHADESTGERYRCAVGDEESQNVIKGNVDEQGFSMQTYRVLEDLKKKEIYRSGKD